MPPRRPNPPPEEDENGGAEDGRSITLRLWQVEERLRDVRRRLARIEDTAQQLARNVEAQSYQIARCMEVLSEQKQRPPTASLFGDNTLVRAVVLGLMALVAALASGQLLNSVGILP